MTVSGELKQTQPFFRENPGAKERPAHIGTVCIVLDNENILRSWLFNFKTFKIKVIPLSMKRIPLTIQK